MTWQTTTSLLPHQVPAVEKMLPTRVGGLFMDMGTGKALPLDTDVLTPTGWKKMRNISVGDLVVGSDGRPTEVIGVYPQGKQEVFRVDFSDGSSAESTIDHLWSVTTPLRKSRGYPPLVLTLGQMVNNGLKHASGNRKYFIPLVGPVEFDKTSEFLLTRTLWVAFLVTDTLEKVLCHSRHRTPNWQGLSRQGYLLEPL